MNASPTPTGSHDGARILIVGASGGKGRPLASSLSCDVLPGYTRTGEMVGYWGHGDPGGYAYMARN